MRLRALSGAAILLVMALVAGGCGPSADQGDIKLGYVAGLSGGTAVFGVPIQQAVDFAVEEINAAGGIKGRKIKMSSMDDKGDPLESVQAVKRLIEADKVSAVITGSGSAAVLGHMDVTKQAKILEISPVASDPKITNSGHPSMFVNIIDNNVFGLAIAYHGVKTLGLKNIAVMVRDDAYGQSITKAFSDRAKELGATIVDQETYPIDAKDFKALLTKAAAAKPDALMLSGYAPESGLIVKQAREMGITVPLLATNPMMSLPYREVAGPAAEGTYVSGAYIAGMAGDPEAKDFITKWKTKTGKDPDVYQAHGYDVVRLLALAIEKAGSTETEKVRAELLKIKEWKGASGATSFNSNGSVVKPVLIVQIKNNEVAFVATVQPPYK